MAKAYYEWSTVKATSNQRRHGIDFADLEQVFDDELSITLRDDHPTEERYVTMGRDARGRLVVVAHTWRGDSIRIISAGTATRAESREYEEWGR